MSICHRWITTRQEAGIYESTPGSIDSEQEALALVSLFFFLFFCHLTPTK